MRNPQRFFAFWSEKTAHLPSSPGAQIVLVLVLVVTKKAPTKLKPMTKALAISSLRWYLSTLIKNKRMGVLQHATPTPVFERE